MEWCSIQQKYLGSVSTDPDSQFPDDRMTPGPQKAILPMHEHH